ncbi:unnamed protein product, partial [Sphacelaria rigidula]
QRVRADLERAAKAIEAVRSGRMTSRAAAKTSDIVVASLSKSVSGSVGKAGEVGSRTVLSTQGTNSIEATLNFVAARQLGLNRDDLTQGRTRRPVPWDPAEGPNRKWLDSFLRRYQRLAERSSHIDEADRVVADEEDRRW